MKSMDVAGGARWNEMTRVWVDQGHQVTVIASMYVTALGKKHPDYKGKLFKREVIRDGLDVIRVHTSEKYNKNFLWRAWAYFTFVFFGFIGALFHAKGKYDVVLASSPPLTVGPLGIATAFIKRCPFVFEIRDLWPEFAIETGVLTNPVLIKIMYFMEKISYKKAKAINALTPAFKNSLIEKKRIPPEKILMIPNGADLELFSHDADGEKIRRQHNWGDRFVGLYVGAHNKANHLWQLIETAKALKNEPEYLIVCLGAGMDKNALVEKAKQEKLDNIQFLPPVPKTEVASYLKACNVSLVVLKRIDAFKTVYPNKMFDSMSMSKPIVLAIDGVARKLVEDDAQCGIFAEPENAEDIAAKMRYYQQSPDIAKKHGSNGYKYACENYDRRRLAEKYIKAIQDRVVEP